MPFLSFSKTNIEFIEQKKPTWRSYDITQALPNTNQINLINKWEFDKAALDENYEIFVIHVAILDILTVMFIYHFRSF